MKPEMQRIKQMTKYQLQLYIAKHKNRNGKIIPYLKILKGTCTKEARQLASQITYANNLLRLK